MYQRCYDITLAFAAVGTLSALAGAVLAGDNSPAIRLLAAFVIAAVCVAVARRLRLRIQTSLSKLSETASSLAGADPSAFQSAETALKAVERQIEQAKSRVDLLTEAKEQSERDLGASATLMEAAYSSLVDAVLVIDSKGRLVLLNPAANAILGLQNNQIGRALVEVLRVPKVVDLYRDACRTEKTCTATTEVAVSITGNTARQKRFVAIIATPLPSPPGGAVVLVRDETELRRLERMRSDFVNNASHELKTPVTSIQGYADSLREGGLEDPELAARFVDRILEQSTRLGEMIVDMLDLSRLESPDIEIVASPIMAKAVVEKVVADHSQVAAGKGLSLRVHIPGNATLLADEQSIHVLLGNLVKNAIEHTPSGGSVEVELEPVSDNTTDGDALPEDEAAHTPTNLVCLLVRDTGNGIPRELQGRIFERFFRVDKSRNRKLGGSGLGLAIVKHTAEKFGGRVAVESTLGTGSTFRVFLPGSAG